MTILLKLTKQEAASVLAVLNHEALNAVAGDRQGRAHLRRVGRVGIRLHELSGSDRDARSLVRATKANP